jgi:hypothetical protein
MCLFTADREPKIAQEDITVYKVMRVSKVDKYAYGIPPYQDLYTYRPGLNIPSFKAETPAPKESQYWYSVGKGYLHAYADIRPAVIKAEALNSHRYYSMSVNKMHIPAGTAYYLGNDHDIASEALYWNPEEQ